MLKLTSFATAALFATSATAFAHSGGHETGSFLAGLAHPLTGIDHLLAIALVGLWAASLGGQSRIMLPFIFLVAASIGFTGVLLGGSVPFIEGAIILSLAVIGLCVSGLLRLSSGLAGVLTAGFAMAHGAAHATEIGQVSPILFAAGFLAMTGALLAAGLMTGDRLRSVASTLPVRVAGYAAIGASAIFAFG